MKALRIIQRIEEVLLATGILAIAALTIINVIARTALGVSLASAEELSQFCIVVVTFVGASYAASQGRHIRMTALYDQLRPSLRKALMLMICFTTAALMFGLAYVSLSYAATVRELGTVSPALQVPLHLIYLAAPVGLTLTGAQYVFTFIRNLRSPEVYIAYDTRDDYEIPLEDGL